MDRNPTHALPYEYALQAEKYPELKHQYYLLTLILHYSIAENRPYEGFKTTVYKTPFRWIHDKNKLTAVNSDALNHLSVSSLSETELRALHYWSTLKKQGGPHG